jgi:hypothetical protein
MTWNPLAQRFYARKAICFGMPRNIGRTMLKLYLSAHEDVMAEIERSTGKKPAPYKDVEEKVLLELFERPLAGPDTGWTSWPNCFPG